MNASSGRLFACLALLSIAAAALAQSEPAPSASRSTFTKLMKVQELWEAENYGAAETELKGLLADTAEDAYEFGLASQYLAHTYVLMDRPEAARKVLEAALARDGIHFQLLANLKLFYGQVVLGDEDFELARRMFADWLATTQEKLEASQLFAAAYANYMTQHHDVAEDLVVRAISLSSRPPDAWYRLHYQVLFELERYDDAEVVLHGLISRDPDDADYWRLLANHHLRREDSRQALAALATAYQAGILDDVQDMRHIVSLYGFVETPERAARLLDEMLDSATVESDFDTLRQLGDLWLLSRERARAIEALQRAAAVAPDGRTDELLASLWFDAEQWRPAHTAFLAALAKGGVEDRDRLHLLAGISAMRAGMPDAARASLREAEKSDVLRSQARTMLRELDGA